MRRMILLLGAPLVLAGCGAAVDSTPATPVEGLALEVFEGPVPLAECGDGSNPETALQGQVSMEDRASNRSRQGYSCNLEQVAGLPGNGAGWGFTWHGDCAYHATNAASATGTVVVDMADPASPVASAYVTTTPMMNPWESLKAHGSRALLAAAQSGGNGFDLYDVSDCRAPTALFGGTFTGASGHSGDFSQDGQTFFSSASGNRPYSWDVSDPAHARVVALPGHFPTTTQTHDLSTNAAGNRMYFAQPTPNGLVILDITDIQERKVVPRPTVVGSLTGADHGMDGSAAMQARPIRIAGRPYILFTNENGSGAARLIDISDETMPVLVSKLKLEVHMPANANAIAPENQADGTTFVYQAHYCGADDPENTTTIACSYVQSGIRVFDVRDPSHPREIAYYSPPLPPAGTTRAGSNNPTRTKSAAFCTSSVRFVRERGELWATCQDNGFLVLRFTNGVWPFTD